MNRQEASLLLPIIKAFGEGKVIEVQQGHAGEWHKVEDGWELNFDNSPGRYRIAEDQPREAFVLVRKTNGDIQPTIYFTKEMAEFYQGTEFEPRPCLIK